MKINKLIAVCALAACVFSASAQISSPYSKFGYGLLNDNATSAQSQMGGVGYAMNSGRQINVMNPASYAAIDSLTFLLTWVWISPLSKAPTPAYSHRSKSSDMVAVLTI